MISTEHAQSLSDFRNAVDETIDRVNQTGEVETLTVDGEPRVILVPPALYEEMERETLLSRDVESIRRSMAEYEAGNFQELHVAMDEIRAELLAMKASQLAGTGK